MSSDSTPSAAHSLAAYAREGAPPPPAQDASAEEKELYWFRHVYQGDRMKQLTLRAVLIGAAIGCCMSIAHLYTSLKIGWGFGVAITSCVISYVMWNILRALTGGRLSKMTILENNCMQSTASAAGYSTGTTVSTAVAAMLMITGQHMDWKVLVPFVFLSGALGVFLAIPMKRQMINVEQLRFPSGIAAAETLKSLYSEGREAMAKAYTLIAGLGVGAVFGILKGPEGVLHWYDRLVGKIRLDEINLPVSWASTLAAAQQRALGGFAFDPSVLLIGAGMITGLRVSLTMLIGSSILYFGFGPHFVQVDSAAEAAHAAGTLADFRRNIPMNGAGTAYLFTRWSLWGGTALMVFASFTALAMQWRTLARAFSIFSGKTGRSSNDQAESDRMADIEVPTSWLIIAIIPITLALVVLQYVAWGTHWALGLLAVALSFIIALVCSRATGETDTTPTGAMGKVTQLLYAALPGAAGNPTINLMTAGVTSNAGLAAADLLTDLKSGYLLGANPRKQFWAQFIGVFFGTACIIPAWYLMIPDAGAFERGGFDAPATQQWRAVAIALTDPEGLSSIARSSLYFGLFGAFLGIIIPTLEKLFPKARPYLPSPMGLGLAWVIGFNNSLSFAIGAILCWIWSAMHKRTGDRYAIPLASGFIAGESMLAAIMAMLATLASARFFPGLAGTP
ncbi:MAG: OPT/YSL family transporter [Phycisphaerae bacterium]|nr:OPT/YSL family transporter [Phycisphaerae bacterium]